MTLIAVGVLAGVFVGVWFHRRKARRLRGRVRGL